MGLGATKFLCCGDANISKVNFQTGADWKIAKQAQRHTKPPVLES